MSYETLHKVAATFGLDFAVMVAQDYVAAEREHVARIAERIEELKRKRSDPSKPNG